MISRFNLDVKRMNFYDDKPKFDEEFVVSHELTNENIRSIDIIEPQILIVFESSLKINISNSSNSKDLILYPNQSISLVKGDKAIIKETKNKISKFKIFSLNNSQ